MRNENYSEDDQGNRKNINKRKCTMGKKKGGDEIEHE